MAGEAVLSPTHPIRTRPVESPGRPNHATEVDYLNQLEKLTRTTRIRCLPAWAERMVGILACGGIGGGAHDFE